MSYLANGYEVGTVLSLMGKEYSILDGFGAYPELTDEAYRCLSESERMLRVEAFYDKLSDELNRDVRSLVYNGYEDIRSGSCDIEDYYRITATANYGIAETVEGKEFYRSGEAVNLFAKPDDEDRHFDGWYSNDELLYAQKEWSFFASQDLELEARFADERLITVTVQVNPDYIADRGAASGGGKEVAGKSVMCYASPDHGYRFARWWDKKTGDTVSTDANFSFTIPLDADPDEVIELIADFEGKPPEKLTNTITLSSRFESDGNSGGIHINASAAYSVTSPVTIEAVVSNEFNGKEYEFTIAIAGGGASGSAFISVPPFDDGHSIMSVSVYPIYDDIYNYEASY